MAMTIASGTRSTATYKSSGWAAAVWAVKRPLPPSSSRSSRAPGIFSRQAPRICTGSLTHSAAQTSIRASKFFFFLIRMVF